MGPHCAVPQEAEQHDEDFGGIREDGVMSRNKYIRDYRLVETIDEGGRIRTGTEYIGPEYRYAGDAASVDRARRTARVQCAAGWIAYFLGLLPNSVPMRTIWVSMPYIFAAVPLALVTGTVFSAPAGNGSLEHRQADRLENRYPPASLATAVLAGISLPGTLIAVLRAGAGSSADAVFALCAAALCAVGIVLFIKRRSFATRKK